VEFNIKSEKTSFFQIFQQFIGFIIETVPIHFLFGFLCFLFFLVIISNGSFRYYRGIGGRGGEGVMGGVVLLGSFPIPQLVFWSVK
jgi:hypothetical protein